MKAKLTIIASLAVLVLAAFFVKTRQNFSRISVAIQENLPDVPKMATSDERFTRRVEALDEKARSGNDLDAYRELGRLYHANGYLHEAWSVYRGLISADPKEAKWSHLLARIFSGYGRLEEAIPLFERSITLNSKYIPSRIHLGNSFLKLNRLNEAEKTNEDVLEIEPKNPHALVGLARIDMARGDWENARDRLVEVTKNSGYKIGADLLADVYEKLGDQNSARAIMHNSQWGSFNDIADPWMVDLMYDCYDAYQVAIAGGWVAHAGDRKAGIRLLRRSIDLDPENAMTHYQLGNSYLADGPVELAKNSFTKSIEFKPDFADAWIGLIRIEEGKGNPTVAASLLERAIQNCPDSPSLNIRKGSQVLGENRPLQAIEFFKKAIEMLPNEAGGYLQLARVYLVTGQEDRAIAEMKNALNAESSNPLALMTLARYSITKGHEGDAENYLRGCVNSPRISERELEPLINAFRATFDRKPTF
ncbi:MAG: tetratricopeptide (TPR) repeat protein [Candidatus Pelagisphaera sp.]|jgi:tetratricopeptide (TPR) repeat protein